MSAEAVSVVQYDVAGITVGGIRAQTVSWRRTSPARPSYSVELVTEGSLWLFGPGGQRRSVARGEYYVMGPHQEYTIEGAGAVRSVRVTFCDQYLNTMVPTVGRPRPAIRNAGRRVQTILEAMAEEAVQPATDTLLMLQSLCLQLGVQLLREQSSGWEPPTIPAAPPEIRRSLEYIHAHYTEELSLDQLSSVAAFSRYHFLRRFQQTTGSTPHAYIRELRLRHAADLLRRSNVPISKIARELGFASPSHLSDAFRRHFGVAPQRFRLQQSAIS